MATEGAGGSSAGPSPGAAAGGAPGAGEEVNRSFDGFDDEEDRDDNMGEIGGEGGRRRIFSKVWRSSRR